VGELLDLGRVAAGAGPRWGMGRVAAAVRRWRWSGGRATCRPSWP